MATLSVAFGTDRPQLFRLLSGRQLVGRGEKCEILVNDSTVSRVQFALRGDGQTFSVVQISNNSTTFVDGVALAPGSEAPLQVGTRLTFGRCTATLEPETRQAARAQRATDMLPLGSHEQLVTANAAAVITVRARVVFTAGPLAGRSLFLDRPRVELGGRAAAVVLPDQEADDHEPAAVLRVAAGRVTLEPGGWQARVGAATVECPLPLTAADEVQLGTHTFFVEPVTLQSAPSTADDHLGELFGTTAAMRTAIGCLRKVAGHPVTVLITGASGTGKGVAARAVHDASGRSGEFVYLNLAAIAPTLFESELFGHEKGAFTGATERRDGAFHVARGGTLFLDEIGEVPIELQAKLLHALDKGEISRVGSAKIERPSVRLVAATNRNLHHMVEQGTFRDDLLFRLGKVHVELPPLKERLQDLPELATRIVDAFAPPVRLSPEGLQRLAVHTWPGNVRELAQVLAYAAALAADERVIGAAHLDFLGPVVEAPTAVRSAKDLTADDIIRHYLSAGGWAAAAERLGLSRTTLYRRAVELQLSVIKKFRGAKGGQGG